MNNEEFNTFVDKTTPVIYLWCTISMQSSFLQQATQTVSLKYSVGYRPAFFVFYCFEWIAMVVENYCTDCYVVGFFCSELAETAYNMLCICFSDACC